MNNDLSTVPRIAVKSVAGGLLLMALFTMMWAGIAEGGFKGRDHGIAGNVFTVISFAFVVYAIYMFMISKRFPKLTEAQKPEGKKMGIWYGIIFGSEGAVIGIMCSLLAWFHCDDFIIPAIALIVGLHFYPMARIFRRSLDYYLATWTCLVAIVGLGMVKMKSTSEADVMVVVGTGVALATSAYGVYMLYIGRQYSKVNQK